MHIFFSCGTTTNYDQIILTEALSLPRVIHTVGSILKEQ